MCTSESSVTFLPNTKLWAGGNSLGRRGRRLRRFSHDGGHTACDFAHDTHQPPMLRLGHGPALHDPHGGALVRFVLLIVDVANRPPADVFAVALMLDEPGDFHPTGLVHLVAGDNAHRQAADATGL